MEAEAREGERGKMAPADPVQSSGCGFVAFAHALFSDTLQKETNFYKS